MKRPDTAWQQAELAELFTTCVRGGIPLAREQLDLILRIVRRLVPNVQTVLDLGCGDGVLGRMLLSEYPQARCAFLDFSQPMLELAGLISINLGILNLLPFPILDGGMILFLLIESVLRREISIDVKERIYQGAFVLLVSFFVFITYNDVVKIFFTHLKP